VDHRHPFSGLCKLCMNPERNARGCWKNLHAIWRQSSAMADPQAAPRCISEAIISRGNSIILCTTAVACLSNHHVCTGCDSPVCKAEIIQVRGIRIRFGISIHLVVNCDSPPCGVGGSWRIGLIQCVSGPIQFYRLIQERVI